MIINNSKMIVDIIIGDNVDQLKLL